MESDLGSKSFRREGTTENWGEGGTPGQLLVTSEPPLFHPGG